MRLRQRVLAVLSVFVVIGIAGCGEDLSVGPVVAPESTTGKPLVTDVGVTKLPTALRPASDDSMSSVHSPPAQSAPSPASPTAPVAELLNIPPLVVPPGRNPDGKTYESFSGSGCGLPTPDGVCPTPQYSPPGRKPPPERAQEKPEPEPPPEPEPKPS